MTELERFIAELGMATLVMAGLLLPYLGPNRRRLIAITSAYPPISLALMMVHCLSTIAVAVLHIPSSAVPPLALAWALALLALEIRSSYRRGENHRPILIGLVVLSLILFVSHALFTEQAMRYRAFTQSLFLSLLLGWLTIETTRARRARRNAHFTIVLIAVVLGLFALIARNIYLASEAGLHMRSAALEARHVLQLRFLAYGCLCFALLALNNAYSAQLWRLAVLQRRAREMTVVTALSDIAQVRDNETGLHIARTRQFVRLLANGLADQGKLALPRAGGIALLARAAPLHDVGKVATPDHILRKPGRLTPSEREIMHTHALIGAEILRSAAESGEGDTETSALLKIATEIAGGHHENWDGSGYPHGLAGEAIPQSARIMSIADVYDALTSARAYKAPWSHDEAVDYIQGLAGTKFDPDIVAVFTEQREAFRAIAQRLRDAPPKSNLFG